MLQGDRCIGRIDMKHQRQAGQLVVSGLWLEPGQRLTRARQRALEAALEHLRRFIKADTVTFVAGYLRS
jgi:uncharacterized protein YcaQ